MNTQESLSLIAKERDRQKDLWGSEYDMRHGPNDWAAIASSYLNAEVSFKGRSPSNVRWRDSMIKAAAVIIAALEHEDAMCKQEKLAKED